MTLIEKLTAAVNDLTNGLVKAIGEATLEDLQEGAKPKVTRKMHPSVKIKAGPKGRPYVTANGQTYSAGRKRTQIPPVKRKSPSKAVAG